MALEITLQTPSTIPLEVDAIGFEAVRGQSPDDVKRTLVQRGNKQTPLGEFFDVQGSADDDEIVWSGDCANVKRIGTRLAFGRMRVEGNTGMHLGAEMTGGEIVVEGNAGDWAGAQMRGGSIRIRGNAGHLAGAAYRGGRKGMSGGEIIIDGEAGNEIGNSMRRGTIAIGGRAGDFLGVGMIAGSIFVFGEAGIRQGAGMKRGTIGLFGGERPPEMLPTFKAAGVFQPTWLRVYLRELRARGFAVPGELLEATYRRYSGDFLELGKGEILVPVAA